MAITKTNFINYTRCSRYFSLEQVKKDRLDADISYDEYKNQEKEEQLAEILGGMFEIGEDEEEIDLVDKKNIQLEAMMPYYNEVEIQAGLLVEKYFGGNTKYAYKTKDQECFDFNRNGLKYLCYIDVYNELDNITNIIEVKATTNRKYIDLKANYPKQDKYSIFAKVDNTYYLKEEIEGYDIESEMPIDKYYKQREKLFDRYGVGNYIYDLAVQRFIIEGEYKESHNFDAIKNTKYYLAVLNSSYIFDGTYEDGKAVYNKSLDSEEIVVFFDMTKITGEFQQIIEQDANKLENNIKDSQIKECPLGKWCGYKKQSCCKYFAPICGKCIPKKNSSLNYIHNGFGFKDEFGERIKGLDLINKGYIDMLSIPESWIVNPAHKIQRDCLSFSSEYIDKEKIRDGLKMLKYPIYHLDFETFPCPMPRFKGEWPYIQSPFEFSLHIEREPGVCDFDKDNYVFLNSDLTDQREEMIKKMLELMDPDEGTLFAQNVTFEKGRIKEMATIFPQYKEPLMKLYDRGFDLLWIINTKSEIYKDLGYDEERSKLFNYYNKNLSGSFSIKKTLPVFSDLSYDNLVVKNGTEAIVEYANYDKMSKEEFALKYEALRIYCKQDTWAMVLILDALRNLVK